MFDTYLFGLSQGLAAFLAVALLLARPVAAGRRAAACPVLYGCGAAVVLAGGFGFALEFASQGLTFRARELLGGALSVGAAALLTGALTALVRGGPGAAGRRLLFAVAFAAVVRDGTDTALFTWSAVRSALDGQGSAGPLALVLLGFATAAGLAYPVVTSVRSRALAYGALAVLAGGALAHGAGRWQSAGAGTADGSGGWAAVAFDLTAAVPPDSWYGAPLTAVLGLPPDPTVLQCAVWGLYTVPALVRTLAPVGFGRSAGGEEKATDEKADSGGNAVRARPPGPYGDGRRGDGDGAGPDGGRMCDRPRGGGGGPLGDEG
ncbi:FTR1 family protein [Streptomyces jumonjinensis]|uniref:FTR1 family protein n=1 Tax=Streptomyces jumonjinensis TaxID=1945 RepID=UPI0037965432